MLHIIPMENKIFTIAELEELTGIKRRTIHFYIKKGMIPGPDKPGGGARYGEKSYLQLLLIKEFQKSHLKLSGIKEVLDTMEINEMRSRVEKSRGTAPVRDKEALDNLLQRAITKAIALSSDGMKINDISKAVFDQHGPAESEQSWLFHEKEPKDKLQEPLSDRFSFLDIGATKKSRVRKSRSKDSYLRNMKRHSMKEQLDTTWTRVFIDDGIELNIRSDVQKKYSREIVGLIRKLKKYSPKGGR